MTKYFTVFLSAIILCLQGCAIGYNTTFFMTKTNFGLDIESKPPTAEISIARREGVIEPSFDGQTLPVVAGFLGSTNPFSNYFLGVSSVFAGGDAASIVTNLSGNTLPPSGLCLKKKPEGKFLWWKFPSLAPQEDEVRPLFFGTDTIVGLKVAWDGMTSEIPDTIKFGFHRKEIAIAPVNGRAIRCTTPEPENSQGEFKVWMAPFLSWIDVNINTGKPSDTKFGYAQGFATGIAAANWASHPKIQQLVLERANPELAAEILKSLKTIPATDHTVSTQQLALANAFRTVKDDATRGKFDAAAKATEVFADFNAFLTNRPRQPTIAEVQLVRKNLESQGFKF